MICPFGRTAIRPSRLNPGAPIHSRQKRSHGIVETSDRSVERRRICQKGPKTAIIIGNFQLFRKNDTSIRTDDHPSLSTELFSGCLDPQNTKNPHDIVKKSDRSVERRHFCQKGPKMAVIRGNFRLFRKNDTSIRTDDHPSLSTESGYS